MRLLTSPVPQKPNSLQHGAEDGHNEVVLPKIWDLL